MLERGETDSYISKASFSNFQPQSDKIKSMEKFSDHMTCMTSTQVALFTSHFQPKGNK